MASANYADAVRKPTAGKFVNVIPRTSVKTAKTEESQHVMQENFFSGAENPQHGFGARHFKPMCNALKDKHNAALM